MKTVQTQAAVRGRPLTELLDMAGRQAEKRLVFVQALVGLGMPAIPSVMVISVKWEGDASRARSRLQASQARSRENSHKMAAKNGASATKSET